MRQDEMTQRAAEIIQKRRAAVQFRADYQTLLVRILLFTVAVWIFFSQFFLMMQTTGNAMFPSLQDGDLLFAFRLQRDYRKSDVLIYQVDNKTYIGRVAACENDVVTMDDTGTLLVNGTPQRDRIFYPSYTKEALQYPYQVPENHVFLLGDYRTQSIDSRDFGAIAEENIKGKVITILRRRGL